MNSPLYLVDSYAIIYRSYFAFIKRPLKAPDGKNVSAVFGFFRTLFALMDEGGARDICCLFDSRRPTFRHEMFAAYKATRQKTPEDLHAQVPIVEGLLGAVGVPALRVDGFEADDLVATLALRAREAGRDCVIVSGDKDLLQLVGGGCRALRPDASGAYKALIGPDEVRAEWGFGPESILDYLALAGDSSDNIPGVAGVGDKTAVALLAQFGGLDGIYARLPEVKSESQRKKLEAGRESAYLSRALATLRTDVPLPFEGLGSLARGPEDGARAAETFNALGMKTLAARFAGARVAAPGGLFDEPRPPAKGATGRMEKSADTSAGAAGAADGLETGYAAKAFASGAYKAVTSVEELDEIVAACRASRRFAFDCETTSVDALRAQVVGFSISTAAGKSAYVPVVAPPELGHPPLAGAGAVKERLRALLEDEGLLLVGHNAKYDFEVMVGWGIRPKCAVFDTMVASWVLDSGRNSYSLEACAERDLKYSGIAYGDVVPKGKTFDEVPLADAAPYAAEDADLTWRLFELYGPALEREGLDKVFASVEMPLLPILAGMERAGVHLESAALERYGAELEGSLAGIQREIYALVGHEFNIASTKQLQEVLFVERRLKTGKKTKTGYSTDTSVLEELASEDPVPALILRHRTLSKLKSTYVDALPRMLGPDGRLHTTFSQTGAATGRLSSRDPNLQNIPVREEEGRRIRAAFTAPEGLRLVSADYSQIELVVLAHLSGDPGLRAAFASGEDVHRRTASLIFGKPIGEVTAPERRAAKTINFGVIYGMSAFRLSNELGIPRAQAQEFIDSYFRTYAGVRAYVDRVVADAERDGYVSTILGRRRPIDGINSSNKTEKAGAERAAVNTTIQGSAADIVKLAMLRVDRALAASGLRARLLLQVHDELILECPPAELAPLAALLRAEMEGAYALETPLKVSIEDGASWGDMH